MSAPALHSEAHSETHYQVRPYFGRWAVVYPLPGGQPGDWAALTDFRTERGARDHAAWLNAGRARVQTGGALRELRDPAVELLLLQVRQRMGLQAGAATANHQGTSR